jgi:ketosteroid isomerase-like protein
MSEENVELLRRMFKRLGRHGENPEALYELLDAEVVWDASGLDFPDGSVYHGHEGVREFWRRWRGTWETWEFWPEEIIDAGDNVVVSMNQRGRGKGSGAEVEARHGQIWRFRNGKIVRHAQYRELDQALEAAGLTE